MKLKSSKKSEKRLYDAALLQQGYFTAKQAIIAGYRGYTHPFHVRSGDWIREYRGIYSLARFPLAEQGQLVLWSLWSRNRKEHIQGTYSYQTALAIHELSDIMPAKLHLTVPYHFRRLAEIPKILTLYYGAIPKEDIEVRQGFKVTRPLRTILDLIQEGTISWDFLQQALKQACSQGLILPSELNQHQPMTPTARERYNQLRQEVGV